MRITCPYCGERPLDEFTFQGDATPRRPQTNDPASMEQWFDYVYLRKNPRGKLKEYWHHSGGCRSWLVVERNSETHAVHAVEAARARVNNKRKRAS
jgi:heterotetrameric sarcosine oxidase delta subunit